MFGDVLRERAIETETAKLDEGDPVPAPGSFDLLIAMGGPMSVNDEGELAWLRDEKRLIREAVTAGQPYWGVCLGAQLLSSALGARVYPGDAPEVGVMPVRLTGDAADDPVFAQAPSDLLTFQWHGDTFDLPERATLLAGSSVCPHQAFRVGNAYGLQFHLEVSCAMADEWGAIPEYEAYVERLHGPGGLDRVLGDFRRAHDGLTTTARALFEAFLDRVAIPACPTP